MYGFTADNSRLQVYDKNISKFKKDKQTPKTIFFEKHKNTIELNGEHTDQIEKLYSIIETSFGKLFHFIREDTSSESLISNQGIYLIKLYLSVQFWRLPLTDEFSEIYLDKIDLKKFGKKITINGKAIGEVDSIRKLLETDSGFRHYFRCFYLPLLTFDLRVHDSDLNSWRLHEVAGDEGGWNNILCSDNPLIVDNLSAMFSFKSKLIFPLSKTQILTYSPSKESIKELPPIFTTRVAMLLFAQSKRYIAGANKKYIKKIIRLYYDVYGESKVNILRGDIFNEL